MTNPQDALYGAWANMRADTLEAAAQIADSFGAKDAAGTIRLLAVAPPPAMPDALLENANGRDHAEAEGKDH